MKNHYLSRFDAVNLRKTVIYFGIALPLIIISSVFGIEKNDWAGVLFLFGMAFFFYALLRLWAKAKYYGIMSIIIIIILALYFTIGMGFLTKTQEKGFGETFAFVGIVGVIVGIIGIFRFRKSD